MAGNQRQVHVSSHCALEERSTHVQDGLLHARFPCMCVGQGACRVLHPPYTRAGSQPGSCPQSCCEVRSPSNPTSHDSGQNWVGSAVAAVSRQIKCPVANSWTACFLLFFVSLTFRSIDGVDSQGAHGRAPSCEAFWDDDDDERRAL